MRGFSGARDRAVVVAFVTSALVITGFPARSGASIPTAHPVTSIKAVGALYFPSVLGLLPAIRGPHFCSGSVVHSTGHNLVLTAAHCVYGAGATIEFAPGYHDGKAPYGVWDVRRIYVTRAWKADQDPKDDYAILEMAPRGGRNIEDVVGAYRLSTALPGASVVVDGYPAGSGGEPLTCSNRTYSTAGYPSFNCHGYVNGVSGGPWLDAGRIVGVTGGLHQGGCTEQTSYSAPFGSTTVALLRRAEAGGRGDVVPIAGSSGC